MNEWPAMEEWMDHLIDRYNEELEKVPEETHSDFFGVMNLKKPVQVHIIGFIKPTYGYVITTNIEEKTFCKAYGPFESKETVKRLEEFTKLPFWDRPYQGSFNPNISTLKQMVEGWLVQTRPGSQGMNEIWDSSYIRFGHGMGSNKESFQAYFGDILSTDPEEHVKKMIKPIQAKIKLKSTDAKKIHPKPSKPVTKPPKEPEQIRKCCYSAFYPPIQIGTVEYTFPERIALANYPKLIGRDTPCYEYLLKGKKVWFLPDGLIIVDTDNKHIACKIINHILIAGMLKKMCN